MSKNRATKTPPAQRNGQSSKDTTKRMRQVFDLNAKGKPPKWNVDGDYPYPKKIGVVEYEKASMSSRSSC